MTSGKLAYWPSSLSINHQDKTPGSESAPCHEKPTSGICTKSTIMINVQAYSLLVPTRSSWNFGDVFGGVFSALTRTRTSQPERLLSWRTKASRHLFSDRIAPK